MSMLGRSIAAPLLILNFIMYCVVLGFASWYLNKLIDGQTYGYGGNGATMFFVIFSILAGVLGVASKIVGASHIGAWRTDSSASAAAVANVAWAVTLLAFGLACKEIHIGGFRGWRLKVLEAFIIALTVTQFLYLLLLHGGVFISSLGPGRDDHVVRGPGGANA
ncbi:membrane protein PM19L-like [Cornus florida]|uniref:membrane protein PM19L-like n=1 Tax=Cornus florida TaxID=4283 RepID=UPI00289C43D8|nr:membrane protein PM19L-like [Cornus florida]